MKNPSIFWAAMFVILQLMLIAVLVPSSWVDSVADMEYQWATSSYSESTIEWMDAKAEYWHQSIVYDSGIADFLARHLLPANEASGQGMDNLGRKLWFPFIESRGDVISKLVEIIIYRSISIIIWIPLIALVVVPSAMDGFIERKIKQHTFQYPSPLLYRYGSKFSVVIGGLMILSFISPIPTPPIALPLGIIAVMATMGLIVIGNMPKRL